MMMEERFKMRVGDQVKISVEGKVEALVVNGGAFSVRLRANSGQLQLFTGTDFQVETGRPVPCVNDIWEMQDGVCRVLIRPGGWIVLRSHNECWVGRHFVRSREQMTEQLSGPECRLIERDGKPVD